MSDNHVDMRSADPAGYPVAKRSTNNSDGTHTDHVNVNAEDVGYSATRSTSDVSIGATGAAGDYLARVILTSVVTVANLTISDGAGTVVAVFTATDTVGTVREVGAKAVTGGFVVDLDATGVGTITAIGRFT